MVSVYLSVGASIRLYITTVFPIMCHTHQSHFVVLFELYWRGVPFGSSHSCFKCKNDCGPLIHINANYGEQSDNMPTNIDLYRRN